MFELLNDSKKIKVQFELPVLIHWKDIQQIQKQGQVCLHVE